MSKNKQTTQVEEQQKTRPRNEFEASKKKMEDLMINGLLQYVKEGTIPKGSNEIHMTCYNIIYNFTDSGYGEELLNFHNDKIFPIYNNTISYSNTENKSLKNCSMSFHIFIFSPCQGCTQPS